MTVIDSDAHVMEPPDLWREIGIEGVGWNGIRFGDGPKVPEVPNDWQVHDSEYNGPASVYADARADNFGPASTVRALDREGITHACLLPTRGLGVIGRELATDVAVRAATLYNQWIGRYCAGGPGRLFAPGLVSLVDPQAAVRVAAAALETGLVGMVTRPNPIRGKKLDHPDYAPFYHLLEQANAPLILHEGTGALLETLGMERSLTYLEAHAMSHPFEQMSAVLQMTVGGVMERHPKLRVGFFEAGAGWLPWWLERLDGHALGLFGSKEYGLDRRPSFYFRRQGFVTMEPEENLDGIAAATLTGNVLFASDYPHGDSLFPRAVAEARDSAGELWPAVAGSNAEHFFAGRRA